MENYKASKEILDLTKEETQYFSQLTEYESLLYKLNVNLTTLESLESFMLSSDDENGNIQIQELKDDQGKVLGTKVVLKIPLEE